MGDAGEMYGRADGESYRRDAQAMIIPWSALLCPSGLSLIKEASIQNCVRGMSGVISKVGIQCAWLSYSSTFRDKKTSVTDEGPTLHHHPFLFGQFSFCHRAPPAKWVWHQLRTKQEIAGWEAKAFTDPLKICKRQPSNGVICKK